MTDSVKTPNIAARLCAVGLSLMLLGGALYAAASPSPHGYIELLFALPLFSFGLALIGLSCLVGSAVRFRIARLASGWAILLVAAAPVLYLLWFFRAALR